MDEQERENLNNERLLKRLYKAAQADIDANGGVGESQNHVQFADNDESKLGGIDKSVLDMHTQAEQEVAKA